MERHRVRKFVIGGILCCVFAWVAFSVLYSQWETKRLLEDIGTPLQAVPPISEEALETPLPTQKVQVQPHFVSEQLPETHTLDEGGSVAEEAEVREEDTAFFTPHPHPDTHAHPHPHPHPAGLLEGSPEFSHLDSYVVKDGYATYNRYRHSDPERAYETLAETFRYMFGDLPEVETMVDFVRAANRRPLTIDEVIDLNNTHIRLLPASMSSSAAALSQQIEYLERLRSDALEWGVPEEEMVIQYDFDFVDHGE